MSYCKIVIGGKERGLKFNQLAVLECLRLEENNKFDRSTLQGELYSTASMIFGGLRGEAYAKNADEDFNWEKCTEWAEVISDESKASLVAAFQATEIYKQGAAYLESQKTADGKKKLVSKNTKRSVTKQHAVK